MRLWRAFREEGRRRTRGGIASLLALIVYGYLLFSGSKYYGRGIDLNLEAMKLFANGISAVLPHWYGFDWGGVIENTGRSGNFEKVLFVFEIGALVELVLLALGWCFRGCRTLLAQAMAGNTDTQPVDPPAHPETTSSTAQTKGLKPMRALGRVFSDFAALAWVLTILALSFLFIPQIHDLAPNVLSTNVPVQGGVTIQKLLVDFMLPAALTLVLLNVLAGRWAPADQIKRNVWISRMAFVAMLALLGVLWVNHGLTGLPDDLDTVAKIALVAITAFAFIDMMYTKGDEFRASSLRQGRTDLGELRPEARRAEPAPNAVPNSTGQDQLHGDVHAVLFQPRVLPTVRVGNDGRPIGQSPFDQPIGVTMPRPAESRSPAAPEQSPSVEPGPTAGGLREGETTVA